MKPKGQITYSLDGSYYLYFEKPHDKPVHKTLEITDEIFIDIDAQGNLLGIEFLNKKHLKIISDWMGVVGKADTEEEENVKVQNETSSN